MIVGLLRWSRAAVVIAAFGLLFTACGGTGEAESPSILIDDDANATTASVESATQQEVPTAVDESAAVSVTDYTPITVQFDPASPPSEEEFQGLVFAAVKADHDNGLWCWANTAACVVDRHLGPAVVSDRFIQLTESLAAYRAEGGVYQAGGLDGIFPVSVSPTFDGQYGDDGFRIVGQVVACEAYSGTYFVPDANGGVGQIINDAPAGRITEFAVWQGQDGVLRTANRVPIEQGGIELCDPHRG